VTSTELEIQTAPTSAWHMYRAMVGVGLFCGLLIVTVFQATLPIIEQNKAEALQRAIFRVLPEATASTTFRFDESKGFEVLQGKGDGQELVYGGYDADGALVGLAIEAQGMGYQDVIALIYGYSFSDDAITGIQVLESKETPGLGDKIESDPDFLENFKRLDVSLAQDGSTLANEIVPVKNGEKTHPWEIDGITGATISSVAIAKILNGSAQHWAPRIQSKLGDFQGGE
jgi:electron transport complex protein RnfG